MIRAAHPLAGQSRAIITGSLAGNVIEIEDLAQTVWHGFGWLEMASLYGNAAAREYSARRRRDGLPDEGDVLYGKIDGIGHLVHETEIGGVVPGRSVEVRRAAVAARFGKHPMTAKEIAEHFGWDEAEVTRMLDSLVSRGFPQRDFQGGSDVYSCTSKGAEAVRSRDGAA